MVMYVVAVVMCIGTGIAAGLYRVICGGETEEEEGGGRDTYNCIVWSFTYEMRVYNKMGWLPSVSTQ